jgi:hypothetical protein
MPPDGNELASGSPWTRFRPENSAIERPSEFGARNESCFSAVEPVIGTNQWVKWVAPCAMAHSFTPWATASTIAGSNGSWPSIVRRRLR